MYASGLFVRMEINKFTPNINSCVSEHFKEIWSWNPQNDLLKNIQPQLKN